MDNELNSQTNQEVEKKEIKSKIDKKKMLILLGFLVLVIVILIGGAIIYNKFFYRRSYSEIEEIMEKATKEYLQENKDELPQNYNDITTITADDLVAAEKMETIAEYLKDENTSCTGKVIVTNINGKYRYNSQLDCGEAYQKISFINYIKTKVPITESGNGLYNRNDELVFRGDNVNNYIKFSGKTFRVVKISGDKTVIIYTEKMEDSVVWDDRYNVEREGEDGINDYSVSRIRDSLNDLYKGDFLNSSAKLLVTAHAIAIGKRGENDNDNSGNIEKNAIIENQFFSLLSLSDYLNASLDENCTTSISKSCANYNYLAKFQYSWWTATADNSTSHKVYRVNKYASLTLAANEAYLRPVLYLASDAMYVSGNGTKNKPWIVE